MRGNPDLPADSSWPAERAEGLLARIRRAVESRSPDSRLSVAALAGELGMSRATLYRRLQGLVDVPPMELIWRYRLEQAAFWLRETDGAIADIARSAGFRSVAHFSSRFRTRYGNTPSQYRRDRAGAETQAKPYTRRMR
jgi:AraC-like DNA-binding protein